MNIEIPADQLNFVQSTISQGNYQNEAEVVAAALALLQAKEQKLNALKAEILPALERLDRGEGLVLNQAELGSYFDDVIKRGLERNRTQDSQ